jgi:hypothetical protein
MMWLMSESEAVAFIALVIAPGRAVGVASSPEL